MNFDDFSYTSFMEKCFQIISNTSLNVTEINHAKTIHAQLADAITPTTFQDFCADQFYSEATYVLAKKIAEGQQDNISALNILFDAANKLSALSGYMDGRIQFYGERALNLGYAIKAIREENHKDPITLQLISNATKKAQEMLYNLYERQYAAFNAFTSPYHTYPIYFCITGNAYFNLENKLDPHENKKILFYLLSSCQEALMLLRDISTEKPRLLKYFSDEEIRKRIKNAEVMPQRKMDFSEYKQKNKVLPIITFEKQVWPSALDTTDDNFKSLGSSNSTFTLGMYSLWRRVSTTLKNDGYSAVEQTPDTQKLLHDETIELRRYKS